LTNRKNKVILRTMKRQLQYFGMNLPKPPKGLLASGVSSSADFLFSGVLKMETKKRCSKCKQVKPLSEFYKEERNKDGLKGWCKSCTKAYQNKYWQTERGKTVKRKANAKYPRTEQGIFVRRKAIAKYFKTPKGKAALRKAAAKRNATNPNYAKAVNAVNHAIRDGRFPRPDTLMCHYCPAQAQQYHHHLGYAPEHWLDVLPTCIKCHTKIHRKIAWEK